MIKVSTTGMLLTNLVGAVRKGVLQVGLEIGVFKRFRNPIQALSGNVRFVVG